MISISCLKISILPVPSWAAHPMRVTALIAKVLAHLDKIDFGLAESDSDVLGDAYEYLIGQFASGAGKKAGEFYTPQQVSKILAKIVTLDKSTHQKCL